LLKGDSGATLTRLDVLLPFFPLEVFVSETENIARIAEKVSKELFTIFGWERSGPRNENWKCACPERHRTRDGTHSSDVAFYYDDPYDAGHVYVSVDLKSYAKSSITRANVAGAVSRLAMATECTELSSQFAEYYVPDHGPKPWKAVGLLFIYNHDGDYSSDFDDLVDQIDADNFALPATRRMFLLGPSQISYLYNIARDITHLRGLQDIPQPAECSFFYPDLVRVQTRTAKSARAASLEWLTGPWQILRFSRSADGGAIRNFYYVYYRDAGTTTDEFKYLFDYLFRFQLIDDGNTIIVRAVPTGTRNSAAVLFAKARAEYVASAHPAARDDLATRLKVIDFATIATCHTWFDHLEIGMRDE
jgi:hypothetical protein